ncbi:MAG: fructosamine kinase family protein [Bdellovibrionales bacterium]|nr:fructosamine kinase family protein [Bdellovibrionales bacterium]
MNIKSKLEKILNVKVLKTIELSGGSVGRSSKLITNNGNFFVKYAPPHNRMLPCEANGLEELRKAQVINIPKTYYVDEQCLVLEYVESHRADEQGYFRFGEKLALLHQFEGEEFGFYEDNFIGAMEQKNTSEKVGWAKWFYKYRIRNQIEICKKGNKLTQELDDLCNLFETKITDILPDKTSPSLIHGDLWSGNYIIDQKGEAWLFDPAVFYAHSEFEFGILNLFGGYPPSFYQGYQSVSPFRKGFEQRVDIYQIYHLLNHYNIFGGSYYDQAISKIKRYV